MASFARSLEVPYSPEQMYALVDRIEDYPQYLPWCVASDVERLPDNRVDATLHLRRGALGHRFATTNIHDAEALKIDVKLAQGPLSFLQGEWTFKDLGGERCRIAFAISYSFSNRLLDRLLGPLFASVYERMVDAFARRADEVYGTQKPDES